MRLRTHHIVSRPHLLYLAWGFPPAAKSCTYRMLATANSFNRAGWRVTVLTLSKDAWLREHGLDESLLDLVDPEIEVERLPLYREDLETDIRTYSRLRAQRPKQWLKWHRRQDVRQFPELVFGRWYGELVEATRAIHDRDPVDLVLTSAAPYTFFGPALDLWEQARVPFVLDYRDAWSIDIIHDRPAFSPTSRRGRIEQRLMAVAHEAWFVNSPIRDAYAQLYPHRADDLRIVMNGSDVAIGTNRIPLRHPEKDEGLVFGYLGTVTFKAERTRALCEGWRLAGERSEVIARSSFVFRGHLGAGSARGVNAHARIIAEYADQGISYGGPVAKAETAAVYASWDALVLSLVGGRYVTSGKVFDYVSTGLPVMSAHGRDHAATEVLRDYPLWVRNDGLTAEDLARAFIATAELVDEASIEDRARARQYAERYERYAQIEPAVQRLTSHVAPALVESAP